MKCHPFCFRCNVFTYVCFISHDDFIKWKHFPRYWPFVREIHWSPVNSKHKGQWCGALMFSLICVWINGWVNNREAGDLRSYCAHYDVIVIQKRSCSCDGAPALTLSIAVKQGKSEGFESCDRPIVRKHPIWVKIGDVLSHVTLKFDGWPWKTIGHLSSAVSSFVQNFIAIGEFKLELQSRNTQFGSNSMIFKRHVTLKFDYDLEKE